MSILHWSGFHTWSGVYAIQEFWTFYTNNSPLNVIDIGMLNPIHSPLLHVQHVQNFLKYMYVTRLGKTQCIAFYAKIAMALCTSSFTLELTCSKFETGCLLLGLSNSCTLAEHWKYFPKGGAGRACALPSIIQVPPCNATVVLAITFCTCYYDSYACKVQGMRAAPIPLCTCSGCVFFPLKILAV